MDKGMRKASEQDGGARSRASEARSADSAQDGSRSAPAKQDRPAESANGGKAASAGKKQTKKRLHPALRVLLWTLRALIVPVLCIAALLGGLYIGYTELGNAPAGDVWKLETWLHMFDLIFSDS